VASLTKKIIGGRPYYYLRECQRINGKPTIVWQKYLGSAEQLVRQLANPTPQNAVVREFGASAACFDLAQQLDLAATVDRHVPKQGALEPSVGQYLLVAVINRCIAPCSKARTGPWYETTVLPRLVRLQASQLTSQRFWDNMDRLDETAIERIEHDLSAAPSPGSAPICAVCSSMPPTSSRSSIASMRAPSSRNEAIARRAVPTFVCSVWPCSSRPMETSRSSTTPTLAISMMPKPSVRSLASSPGAAAICLQAPRLSP
jgi:hypothetical protein